MDIEKDKIWEVFSVAETYEAFQKYLLRPVYLNPKVPEDVRDLISVAQKLLKHSYFEYEFIDIALTHSIFTFEKALRIRWAEINGESTKLTLAGLIDWFHDNNYFETWNKEIPHQLRHIRNNKAHDEKKSLGGVGFLNKVYSTIDLINDLYEEVSLRLNRKNKIDTLEVQFNLLFKKGGILIYNEQKLIVFNAYPLFINNKLPKNILNISTCPIFDLAPYKNNDYFFQRHIQFSLSDWELSDEKFTAIDAETGMPVIITNIEDETNRVKFDAWEDEFMSCENWHTILFSITEPLNDYFIEALRKFHQQ